MRKCVLVLLSATDDDPFKNFKEDAFDDILGLIGLAIAIALLVAAGLVALYFYRRSLRRPPGR